jgi:hypothetical protein
MFQLSGFHSNMCCEFGLLGFDPVRAWICPHLQVNVTKSLRLYFSVVTFPLRLLIKPGHILTLNNLTIKMRAADSPENKYHIQDYKVQNHTTTINDNILQRHCTLQMKIKSCLANWTVKTFKHSNSHQTVMHITSKDLNEK